ncbi:hypothetical protein ACIP4X_17725 [Streptomyces sp. NPDC088817]|uniref:hypothetical protein n=1 Tax=Streptomyces sp. NPDC088817 TaxID=3365907 RepID=UPI0037F8ADC6
MIAYAFLTISVAGVGAVAYYVAPAGRGAHRYVVPRSMLRAEAARHAAAAEEATCKLVGLAVEFDAVSVERDDLEAALDKAGRRIDELEEQVRDRDQLREANTALQAALANARKVSQLPPHGDTQPPSASALPDHAQEFVNATPTAWRASA